MLERSSSVPSCSIRVAHAPVSPPADVCATEDDADRLDNLPVVGLAHEQHGGFEHARQIGGHARRHRFGQAELEHSRRHPGKSNAANKDGLLRAEFAVQQQLDQLLKLC
eukprot:scaffold123396_cov30-Tisochrysis_lutea.AAC.1